MQKNAFTVPEFAKLNSISRATVYREASDGRLSLTKIRGRTLITATEGERWLSQATKTATKPKAHRTA